MIPIYSKFASCSGRILRASSSILGRRLFSDISERIEYEIIENAKTFPLFSDKIQYIGPKETSLKYFKESEWMKTSDKLIFNADAEDLAERIPGKMDGNMNFVASSNYTEQYLYPSTKVFEDIKGNMDSFLSSQQSVFVQDGKLGTTDRTCVHVRSVTNDPTIALILKSLTFPIMDVKSKEDNEYNNNLTVYIARGNNTLEQCINGQMTSGHNYTLLVNGDCSIRQIIDEISSCAGMLYNRNNRDVMDLVSGEVSSKDAINTVIAPCSCIRAKNGVSCFLYSDCANFNAINHERLDEIHRSSFSSGSLYTLDHTVISNGTVNALFGGVQLNNHIGTMISPTNSLIVNDSVLTSTSNDKTCSIPSSYLFIQNKTGMKEMSYDELKKLVKTWTRPDDMGDYLLAWSKVNKVECFKISQTIMKDVITEMESIEYNVKP